MAFMLRDAGLAGASQRRIALACLVTLAPRLAAAEVAFGEDAGLLRLVRAAMVGDPARHKGAHAAMSPNITACYGRHSFGCHSFGCHNMVSRKAASRTLH